MFLGKQNVFGTSVHSDHKSDWKSCHTGQDLKQMPNFTELKGILYHIYVFVFFINPDSL